MTNPVTTTPSYRTRRSGSDRHGDGGDFLRPDQSGERSKSNFPSDIAITNTVCKGLVEDQVGRGPAVFRHGAHTSSDRVMPADRHFKRHCRESGVCLASEKLMVWVAGAWRTGRPWPVRRRPRFAPAGAPAPKGRPTGGPAAAGPLRQWSSCGILAMSAADAVDESISPHGHRDKCLFS